MKDSERWNSTKQTDSHNASKTKETFIENRNTAIELVIMHLSRYANNEDILLNRQNILNLWVVRPRNDSEIPFVDEKFDHDLIIRLTQTGVEFIDTVKITSISRDFIENLIDYYNVETISEGRIYYKLTGGIKTREDEHKSNILIPNEDNQTINNVFLECVKGSEYVEKYKYDLIPSSQTEWKIGRGTQSFLNDIIIKDEITTVSRRHAAIVWDNGNWYGRCRDGSCRRLNCGVGPTTKLRREETGKVEELDLYHKKKDPLKDGDIIIISPDIEFKFCASNK